MVLRIVADVIRRKWKVIAFAVFQISLYCKTVRQIWPGVDVWAMPLAIGWFLTIPAGPMFQYREMYQLPVSRRTWWLAWWALGILAGVVVPTLALALAFGMAESRLIRIEEFMLLGTFAFLFSGCAMAMMASPIARRADQPVDLGAGGIGSRAGKGLAGAMPYGLVMILGPMTVPFFLARYLPHTFAEITPAAVVVMLAIAVIVALGYFHQPALEARHSMRVEKVPPAVQPANAAPVPEKPRFADQLTGVRLALWDESRKQLFTFASVLIAGVIAWVIASEIRRVPSLSEVLNMASALPFASHRAQVTEFITWGALFFAASMVDSITASAFRPIRALPLSTNRVSCLAMGLGLLSASALWVVLVIVHFLVLRTVPVAPRIDLFLAFAGLMAFSHAIRFVTPGQMMARSMIAISPMMIIWLVGASFDSWRPDIVQPGMLVGGLALLGLSFAMMRWSVARNSRMYRPAALIMRFR